MGRRALQLKSVWDPIQLLQAFAEHGIRPKHAQKIWRSVSGLQALLGFCWTAAPRSVLLLPNRGAWFD
eukprot:1158111-Pelagomonas_calceolata.AAC.2